METAIIFQATIGGLFIAAGIIGIVGLATSRTKRRKANSQSPAEDEAKTDTTVEPSFAERHAHGRPVSAVQGGVAGFDTFIDELLTQAKRLAEDDDSVFGLTLTTGPAGTTAEEVITEVERRAFKYGLDFVSANDGYIWFARRADHTHEH